MEERIQMKLLHIAGLSLLLWLAGCATSPGGPGDADATTATANPVQGAAPVAAAPAVIPTGPLAPITAAEAASRAVAQLEPPADLWERIRRGYRMPNLDGDLVR